MAFDDANAFMQEQSGKYFPFPDLGTTISGMVLSMDVRQQTDLDGNAKTFDNGDPVKVLVIQLQTDLHDDPDDDGIRAIWLRKGNVGTIAKGSGRSGVAAVFDAVKRAGTNDLEAGGYLTVTHSGVTKPKDRGMNGMKLFEAEYKVPAQTMSMDDLA